MYFEQDLSSLFLPPPDGTLDDVERAGSVASSVSNAASSAVTGVSNTPSPTVGVRVKHAFDNCPSSMNALQERIDGIRSTSFPLYPPAGVAGVMRNSVKLPISLCWVKQVRPKTLDRITRECWPPACILYVAETEFYHSVAKLGVTVVYRE